MACCQQWLKQNSGTLLWGTAVFVSGIDLFLWADYLNEWSKNHAHLIKMLAAFAPAIIAGIAVMIANRQHRTAVNKLKLDLFEKRFKYYERMKNFFECEEGYWGFRDFQDVRRESNFMFDRELRDWLEKIFDAANEISTILAQHSESSDAKALQEARAVMRVGSKELTEKFYPFLKIEAS